MNDTYFQHKAHHGRNIKRIREILGIKQEALALTLGNDWTQRRISLLEQKEEVEDHIIEEISAALKISAEAIKKFNDESAINIVSNSFSDFHDHSVASAMNYQCNFNPIDKIIQLFEEKEKLYQEKIELYERMLKDKEEMIERLGK
jgi:transcriptional regulator with XRE-family HTH domain